MRIERLFRFPVKGLPAEELSSATASVADGLRGDRAVALGNGSVQVEDGVWQSCGTFTALKNDVSLQKWQVSSAPPFITVTAPAGSGAEPLTFNSADPEDRRLAAEYLSGHIPAQGGYQRTLVAASQGMFDSRLAGISLINPRTVEVLSRAAGVELDPLRYRGNILLEGVPAFGEFDLIGKVVRVGTARIAITKSIERCPATSVNPSTTQVDVNGPRLLASHFGHLHCGIYGTVLEAGAFQAGDEIHVDPEDSRALGLVGSKRTPRFLEVVERRALDSDAVQLSLRDPHGWIQDNDEPGTHLRVHLPDPLWRNYTITSVHQDIITIAVHTAGTVSQRMAQLQPGDKLLVSGPHGTMTASRVLTGRTALLTAGIGITPTLALLRGADQAPELRELHLFHTERSPGGELFTQASALARETLADARITHVNTRERRPTLTELAEAVATCDSVMICGPAGFTDLALAACQQAGIAPENIHRETFVSPTADLTELLEQYTPAQISFSSGAAEFTWRPQEGTLLESLESHGLKPKNSCRAGACGECALTVRRGSVSYLLDPSARVQGNQILACVAAPTEDLELQL
ncbi:MOSC domain-containing protein [Glutamicibacter sp. NPDC087344]|uniref:MOSC domain-containing protein n=1 Tax=Glutamicibacter sp. NPDC087344 TaxID=3363994 RepID=UPI0038094A36